MNHDELIICNRCGSDAAYVQEINDKLKLIQCMGCGFLTNSLMKEGEEFYKEQVTKLPELYKDLIFTDKDQLKWIPSTITHPERGTIFINGTNVDNWEWVAILAISIPESEQSKFPIPGKSGEFYKHRMDQTTLKKFGQRDYIGALEYLNLI